MLVVDMELYKSQGKKNKFLNMNQIENGSDC